MALMCKLTTLLIGGGHRINTIVILEGKVHIWIGGSLVCQWKFPLLLPFGRQAGVVAGSAREPRRDGVRDISRDLYGFATNSLFVEIRAAGFYELRAR